MEQAPPTEGLKTGFSTGACSAAAARAAMLGLVEGVIPEVIECQIPNGTMVKFVVAESSLNEGMACAVVVKDAGDDPDVTDKARLIVTLRPMPLQPGEVNFIAGPGVGHVTLSGLGLEVGGPAINPVPRKNIIENLHQVGADYLKSQGIEVTIAVPGGEKMARRTLNERLGILGGISILGTSGLVKPYSTAAFKACVVQGVEVAASQGLQLVVVTTGGRTEKFTQNEMPDLPQAAFVQMGDFLGTALETAQAQGIPNVVIGAMVGKLSKIAQGESNTHARKSKVNMRLLALIAQEVGADEGICEEIRNAQTARFAAERLKEVGLEMEFYKALARETLKTLESNYPMNFRILVCDFEGNKLLEMAAGEG